MFLTVHAAVGTAIGLGLPPVIAQATAFGSHFIFDAIPHTDLNKITANRYLLYLAALGDGAGAFAIHFAITFYSGFSWPVFLAAVMACLPDVIKEAARHSHFLRIWLAWIEIPVAYAHWIAHSWERLDEKSQRQLPRFPWQSRFVAVIGAGFIFFSSIPLS